MSKDFTLEICIDSVESAVASQSAGADRVELCSGLFEGGLTPSAGMIAQAREAIDIGLSVMIRPRGGDFFYTDIEYQIMERDIAFAKELGADCIVLGLLNADGEVDKERTARLVELARPCEVTFHRAIDMAADPFAALGVLIELGVDRVLTSGQEESVLEGAPVISQMVDHAKDQIIIMPGGGVNERNFERVFAATGANEYHVALNESVESAMRFRNPNCFMGGVLRPPEFAVARASAKRIQALRTG